MYRLLHDKYIFKFIPEENIERNKKETYKEY